MNQNPVPAEEVYDQTAVSDPVLSPNGEWVAFILTEADPAENQRRGSLHVAPVGSEGEARRLTRMGDAKVPKWSPDGERLGFITDRAAENRHSAGADGGTRESRTPQVWAFDVEKPGDAEQLTAIPGGVREFDWGPNGTRVVVTGTCPENDENTAFGQCSAFATDRLQYKSDERGWHFSGSSTLYVVDTAENEVTHLEDAVGAGASEPSLGMQPSWCPTADTILFVTNERSDAEASHELGVYEIDVADGTIRELVPPYLKPSNPTWNSDGTMVALNGSVPAEPYRTTGAWVLDVRTGELNEVSDDIDFPVPTRPLSWESTETLLGIVHAEGRTRLARFYTDERPTTFLEYADMETQSIGTFRYCNGNYTLTLSDPGRSTDLYAGSALHDPEQIRPIQRTNQEFSTKYTMPEWQSVRFESDGYDVEGFAYLPPDFDPAEPEPAPTIVAPHGGPVTCDVPQYHFDWSFWTSRGYVVLRVNYRGSTSYGTEFCQAIAGRWGTVEWRDTLAGVEHLVETGWSDPGSLYIQGFSYGAAIAAATLIESERFSAAVLEHGNYDYAGVYGTSDLGPYLESNFGTPWNNPSTYADISTLPAADRIDTPCLIMAGGRDYRAPVSQSERLYRTLRRRDTGAELVVYPREGHGVSTPDRTIDRLQRIESWFERH